MTTSALRRRPGRLIGWLAGGLSLVLLLGAAASPSSPRAAVTGTHVAAGARGTADGRWGAAREVAAALNRSQAEVNSVSCASAGNCAAGGFYNDSTGQQAFVVSEVNGRWDAARTVAAALNTGDVADVDSVSCASAGNCAAGGFYNDSSGQQAFVVSEVNGRWGAAQTVAAALNGGSALVTSVSCPSAGNCTAGGNYRGSSGWQAFVVSEMSGRWDAARTVAAALNTAGNALANSVSCVSADNCTAGGSYHDSSGQQAFVVSEVNGAWGAAREVAAALNTGGDASVNSVSCASAGTCTAGGNYNYGSGWQAFVVSEVNGAWGAAREVAGALNTGGDAWVISVSCTSAGNCTAGGSYHDSSGHRQAFVVSQDDGTWGAAREVAAALNQGDDAGVNAVSCASAGDCTAGGSYDNSSGQQAFVVSEVNGAWGAAREVAAALNQGEYAAVYSVSCASPEKCAAGGYYLDSSRNAQAFVVNKS